MQDPTITYFPVRNGDCSLITLSDNTQILIDCNITVDSRDKEEEELYDVHLHLLKYGKKLDGKIPHIDAFILTHPDQDHCRGFQTTFYMGDPAKYSNKHLDDGLLLIDELWFTPRIIAPHEKHKDLCESAQVFRNEAVRRMDLHKARAANRDEPGNRIRVIGYSDNPDLQGLEHVITVPGTYVDVIDAKLKTDFSFFVHAPFKVDTDDEFCERNDTSLVLQARFDAQGVPQAGFALFGGDAGAAIWEKILERSEAKTLLWDLFLAPHHCSWTFFSEQPYKENKIPAATSLEILDMAREGGQVIASCKPIRNNDDNPPHWAAKAEYEKVVGADRFHVISETPSEDCPLPIVFAISENGPVQMEMPESSAITSSAAKRAVLGTPQTYG